MAADSGSTIQPIEAAWQERRDLFDAYSADDSTFDDPAKDRSYWDRIDQTEAAIIGLPDNSLRAAEIRIWVAWWHCDTSHGTAIAAGDTGHLRSVYADLNWHEKLIFSAILNLRGEAL